MKREGACWCEEEGVHSPFGALRNQVFTEDHTVEKEKGATAIRGWRPKNSNDYGTFSEAFLVNFATPSLKRAP